MKEVFKMAGSRFIEEESGRYTGQIRHPHNGYYAGDFFSASWSPVELPGSYAERRYVRSAAVMAGIATAIPLI